jgi:3-oxoacyl-[acyl-carrier protein] reductase
MAERTALVGGGSSGIGRAAARQITAETGAPVLGIAHDLSDPSGAPSLLAQVADAFGAPDVLVLNAGGPPPGGVLDIDDEGWRAATDLLLIAPLALARHVLLGMADRGFGRVVVVTSTAVRQPQPGLAASVVLRAAMTSAAKLLSREYAQRGVTVNCVAPGATDTPRRREVLAARAQSAGLTPDVADAQDAADVPAGRAGSAEEVAAVIGFLVGDAASYVNGTVITVDGGRTETV